MKIDYMIDGRRRKMEEESSKISQEIKKKFEKKSDNNHADLRFGLDQFGRLVFLLYVFSIPTLS